MGGGLVETILCAVESNSSSTLFFVLAELQWKSGVIFVFK